MAAAYKCDVCGQFHEEAPAFRVCNELGDFILTIDAKCGDKVFGKYLKNEEKKGGE